MRTQTTLLALAAMASPLMVYSLPIMPPIVLSNLENVPITSPKQEAPRPATPATFLDLHHHRAAQIPLYAGKAPNEITFDNSPVSIPSSVSPQDRDAILAAPRPVTTEFLMAGAKAKAQSEADVPVAREKGMTEGDVATSIVQLETGIVVVQMETRVGVPCRLARIRRARNDALVVGLVLVFFAVVVIVEMGGAVVASLCPKEGSIRLEDAAQADDAEKQPLSIQADPENSPPQAKESEQKKESDDEEPPVL